MNNVVDFRNVSVRRGGKYILKNVDWTIEPGQNWVILGANGAGKTTLVNLLTGRVFPCYEPENPGEAKVLDYQLGKVDVTDLRTVVGIASSHENHLFDTYDTVLNIVVAALYGKTIRGREAYDQVDIERAKDLLKILAIDHLTDRIFASLSQGEAQRVLIARALVADPEILVLDEPTAGLDMGARELLLLALEEIAKDRHAPALVLVTHHVEEIPVGFTHAILLKEAQVQEAGPIAGVLTNEKVSATFDLPLEVELRNGRWSARAQH
ncbi:ATP-binding cassette domain-containing protein [Gleimia sp. 6138-11-ORH1]|uniref:ABC transporter ATP-binding protein n=1 Tax=Gleimia sp. 6138-11-ORH1 TaxID=2973937 RepID=UPI0021682088|nr:ATP-binding cassette domain-containing protein [Gleimia sp. 6138-11-ORH1]MCS4484254.1 ATP-binding cassette domain-containing protein [Gleimia sp. 6138-11-ORH1]